MRLVRKEVVMEIIRTRPYKFAASWLHSLAVIVSALSLSLPSVAQVERATIIGAVTDSNENEGFAKAVRKFILQSAGP